MMNKYKLQFSLHGIFGFIVVILVFLVGIAGCITSVFKIKKKRKTKVMLTIKKFHGVLGMLVTMIA